MLLLLIVGNVSYILRPSPSAWRKLFDGISNVKDSKERYESEVHMVQSLEQELARVREEYRLLQESYAERLAELNSENYELHMPSVLILLEQNAKYFGLDLTIHYSRISGGSYVPQSTDPDEEPPSVEFIVDPLYLDGVETIAIPITVIGGYEPVRDYVQFLDRVDFIEPNQLVLMPDTSGSEVEANILLYVFMIPEGGR